MMDDTIVICGGARTAMAEYSGTPGYGAFAETSAIELGARRDTDPVRYGGCAFEPPAVA